MATKRRTGIERFHIGPKRSRVRVGLRAFIFFAVAALAVGAYAIALNVDLEDRFNAYQARFLRDSGGGR